MIGCPITDCEIVAYPFIAACCPHYLGDLSRRVLRAYARDMFRLPVFLVAISFACVTSAVASAARVKKPHYAALGSIRTVPYSIEGDPAGASPGETTLKVRPLVVNGIVKDWTTGEPHPVTESSFTVRSAIRMNDSLPTDHVQHWVWQRGPWLLVDKSSEKITTLRLPDFDSSVSNVVWFRNYAAYCGLSASGKQLYGVVAEIAVRKPVLRQKIAAWGAAAHPSPACAPAVWQRQPLQVSFLPAGGASVSFDLSDAIEEAMK